jgi:hypothetical protein
MLLPSASVTVPTFAFFLFTSHTCIKASGATKSAKKLSKLFPAQETKNRLPLWIPRLKTPGFGPARFFVPRFGNLLAAFFQLFYKK